MSLESVYRRVLAIRGRDTLALSHHALYHLSSSGLGRQRSLGERTSTLSKNLLPLPRVGATKIPTADPPFGDRHW